MKRNMLNFTRGAFIASMLLLTSCFEQEKIEDVAQDYAQEAAVLYQDIKEHGLDSPYLTQVNDTMRDQLSHPEEAIENLHDLAVEAYKKHAAEDPNSAEIVRELELAQNEFRYGNFNEASEHVLSAGSIMMCSKFVYIMPGSFTTRSILHLTGYDRVYDLQETCYNTIGSSPEMITQWVNTLAQRSS